MHHSIRLIKLIQHMLKRFTDYFLELIEHIFRAYRAYFIRAYSHSPSHGFQESYHIEDYDTIRKIKQQRSEERNFQSRLCFPHCEALRRISYAFSSHISWSSPGPIIMLLSMPDLGYVSTNRTLRCGCLFFFFELCHCPRFGSSRKSEKLSDVCPLSKSVQSRMLPNYQINLEQNGKYTIELQEQPAK